ncbi:RloB domain-containing protein [Proteus columbae]|uniref:RloB domain-containing protein n=1 Tax=Proteus columbae TaxID=1987580 RepID=UPI0018C7024E|nr:RloB domain-containing protein [Proteus mirabilis]
MTKRKNIRKLKKTLLAVGEGSSEKAFLSHLKSIYSKGDPKVTVVTAGGKGPNHVINHAIACMKCDGYDECIVLLDTDIPWPPKLVKQATGKGICLIGSEPCLEGFLLDILSRRKTNTNNGCKELLHPLLNGESTSKDSYKVLFTKEILEGARVNIVNLNSLINAFG